VFGDFISNTGFPKLAHKPLKENPAGQRYFNFYFFTVLSAQQKHKHLLPLLLQT